MNFDMFWHRFFKRPYRLYKSIDTGSGETVVLLHGIGRSGQIWQPLVRKLVGKHYRLVAFDLLGFGASPKPDVDYTIDDHTQAAIASIERLRGRTPVVLVGHSMGALVAVRLARLRPDLVKHVVLYEMPLYEGLPGKRRYAARLKVYYASYEWVTKQQPTFGEAKRQFGQRMASKIAGSELTEATWGPFKKSLQNTIMHQTAADDIKQVKCPVEVIYGTRDMFVIRGKVKNIFGSDAGHVTAHTVKARHRITDTAAAFLAARITAVYE